MKLGAIAQGVDDDFAKSLETIRDWNMEYVELGSVWDVNVGQHSAQQEEEIVRLVSESGLVASAISPLTFYTLPVLATSPRDATYRAEIDGLVRSAKLAKRLGTRIVRIMSFIRPPVTFGYEGAERHLAHGNRAWSQLLKLLEEPVAFAEENDIVLAVETGADTTVSSCSLAARMIREIGSSHLKVLWDTGNNLFSTERQFPDGYEAIRDHIAHIQVKDARADVVNGSMTFCALGDGDLADQLEPLAAALKSDGYAGVVSLENVYRPVGAQISDTFAASARVFMDLFS